MQIKLKKHVVCIAVNTNIRFSEEVTLITDKYVPI